MVNLSDILNASILIVDDLDANVQLLKRTLASAGYIDVTSTMNPIEVYELHRKHRYDLILLDLLMPELDGFQVMEKLKEIETDSYLPVIVITAFPEHKLRALQAGAKDFINTPFDLPEVLARVHNMLEVRLLNNAVHNYNDVLEQRVRERVAELEDAHRQLRDSALRYREVFENISDGLFLLDVTEDLRFKLVEFNPAQERSVGYSTSDVSGKFVEEVIPEESSRQVIANYRRCVEAGAMISYDEELALPCGSRSFFTTLIPVRDAIEGRIYRLVGIARDITERKKAETDLRIAATAFESQESMMITDSKGVILRVNQAFTESTGYSDEEAVGKTPRLLKSGHHDTDFYRAMWETIRLTGAWQGEIWDRRKNGEVYPIWLTISAVKGNNGVVTHYVGSHFDITERKHAEEQIKHLAFYDHLTRLPNRRLLLDRLQQALASSGRSGRKGALIFIDLDNFKTLNDTLGHDIGDLLLQQVAQRLETCLREGDSVARLGGDEFVVLLEELSKEALEAAAQAEGIGEKILITLNQPYYLGKHEHYNTPSIGITLFNEQQLQQASEDLFKQADLAMYQAKNAGRNTLRFFDPKMQEAINARTSIEVEMRKALENHEFHLYYQIQVDSSRHPIGAEALIRWKHPERGLISPAQFIPLAEESGRILSIGGWVLETACAQLKTWQKNELTHGLILSINVSAKQIHQANFVAEVQAAIQRHDINPKLLKLELTESMLLVKIEATIATMNALKEIGVRISLDDFGTGYSSLQYLKRLPLYQLKIDQSFVRDIAVDENDKAIVRTIIAMAQSLNLDVIAEGVETDEQQQFLESAGCNHYQGYLFGKPVQIEQFEAQLNTH